MGLNNKKLSPAKLLGKLNIIAGKNGIGRADLLKTGLLELNLVGFTKHPGELCYYLPIEQYSQ